MDRVREAEAPSTLGSIGPYELIEEVSRGGQGIVYRARQPGTKREIVVKRLLAGSFATPAMLRRFEREVELAASLNHPNIVTVFGIEIVGGQPLLAMEWIDGVPIDQWAMNGESGRRSPKEIAAMLHEVCAAVRHAHQRGVIHRDLKPSNVLVDKNGVPHVLDFGLARPIGPDAEGGRTVTMTEQFVGTPAYASPEHLRSGTSAVDVRADVYSLGLILYQALTGSLPYDVSGDLPDIFHRIENADPIRPSSVAHHLDREIEAIVLKALAKEKERRYQSVDLLADDLQRYLHDEPVTARPPSTLYQLGKFAKRNKRLVTAVFIALVALTWAMVNAMLERNRALRAEQAAERQAAIAQAVNDFLNDDLLSSVDPLKQQGRDVTVLEVLDKASAAIEDQFTEEPLVEAAIRMTLGNTYINLGRYELAEPHINRALTLRQEQLGDDHTETLKALQLFGHLLVRQGRYTEAETFLVKSLELHRRVLGEDDPDTLSAMEVLGVLYRRLGRYDDAEPLYVEVMEARRRVLGEEHRHTIVSIRNLAILYKARGEYDKAESYYTKALELGRRVMGPEHPDTLSALSSLAALYQNQGKLDQAESLYLEVLQSQRRVLGHDHPDTLASAQSLAYFYMYQGKHRDAESLFRETLEARRRVLGEEHPHTLETLYGLSAVYNSLGQYDQAEPLMFEVLKAQRHILGEDNPSTVTSVAALAKIRLGQGRAGDALPLYREALEKRRRAYGDDSPKTLYVLRGLVATLNAMENFEEAAPLAIECYERHARVFGPTHKHSQAAIALLVDLYQGWGKHDKADEFRALLTEER
jgi:tetratricopeptide (TPR) repeat protein/tRNA A-37 threonylcarbamoyl transferase component Bud32